MQPDNAWLIPDNIILKFDGLSEDDNDWILTQQYGLYLIADQLFYEARQRGIDDLVTHALIAYLPVIANLVVRQGVMYQNKD